MTERISRRDLRIIMRAEEAVIQAVCGLRGDPNIPVWIKELALRPEPQLDLVRLIAGTSQDGGNLAVNLRESNLF